MFATRSKEGLAIASPQLCSTCGLEPRAQGQRVTQCKGCRKKSVDSCNRVTHKLRVATGMCPRCGKHPQLPGMKRCKVCSTKRMGEGKAHRSAFKTTCVAYLGGACLDCGLVAEYLDVYDFHHRKPSEKEFCIATAHDKAWDHVQQELDKCDLLCANCHRIRHAKQNLNKE